MPLKVLGVIAVVVILLLCLPVGVDAGYCDGQLTIRLRLGAVTIGLYPTKPRSRSRRQCLWRSRRQKKGRCRM